MVSDKRLSFILLLFMTCAVKAETTSSDFVINIADTVQSAKRKTDTEKLFSTIYENIGITPQFKYLPSLRGLDLVNKGIYDAEAGRLVHIAQPYENLIKIPTAVALLEFALFCERKEHCTLNKNLNVAVLAGFRRSAHYCKQVSINCTQVKSVAVLARLIKEGFADAFLAATMIAPQITCLLDDNTVYFLPVKELDTEAFHFIHKKHASLAPAIDNSILQLKNKGLIDELLLAWKQEVLDCNKNAIEV